MTFAAIPCCRYMRLLLLGMGVVCAPFARAESWPQVEAPPNANVQWVGDNIVQNGVPMQIKAFSTENGVADVIGFYRSRWASDAAPPAVNSLGDWQIIGRQQGDFYITVQARTGNDATEGFIGISRLPGATKPGPRSDFPRLGGTDLVSSTDSVDGTKSASTIVMENNFSIESNVSFYESNLPSDGWTLLQSKRAEPSRSGTDGHSLYFNRRKQSCHIVISPANNGATLLVVNVVSNNI